jgi:CheY-like chemotaxis protein
MMARILLADDASAVRFSIAVALRADGHEVTEASDGGAAIGLLRTRPFDLVITDLWMPVLDGIDLLKHLRVHHPEMKVIAMSGGAPERAPIGISMTIARAWGADAVFQKPFDNDDLLAEVRRLLAG